MHQPNRPLAFLAYLLPLVGPLLVLLIGRKNSFALFHACQALGLLFVAVLAPVVWLVISLVIITIPWIGSILSNMIFALVIAAYIAIAVGWISGLVNSLRGQLSAVPVLGGWGEGIFDYFEG
jgi:uncharacterized membrane protein